MLFTFLGMEVNAESENPQTLPIIARLGQAMGITSQLYVGLLERLLAPHRLTYPQFALLVHLGRRSGSSRISDLAAAVEVNQPAVTKAVQKFEGLGLVALEDDPSDKRIRRVSITPKGRAQLTEIQQSFGPAFARLTDGWDMDELLELTEKFEMLGARLNQMRDR